MCIRLAACGSAVGSGSSGSSGVHKHSATYYNVDLNSHWKICDNCGEQFDSGEHKMGADGYCTLCDYTENYTKDLVFGEDTDYNDDVVSYYVTGVSDKTISAIVIPTYYNGKPVTHILRYAFQDCSSLTSIEIPNSVTSIGYGAFSGCSSLTSITIPNSVTIIAGGAFYGCSSLKSIEIPNSVTSIGEDAFKGCEKLIKTENGVQYVDKWVIDCDNSIKSVTLRSNTVGIGDRVFYYCSSLTSVSI